MKVIEQEKAMYSGETFVMCEYNKRRVCDSFYVEENNKLKKLIFKIKEIVKGTPEEEKVLKEIQKYNKE